MYLPANLWCMFYFLWLKRIWSRTKIVASAYVDLQLCGNFPQNICCAQNGAVE